MKIRSKKKGVAVRGRGRYFKNKSSSSDISVNFSKTLEETVNEQHQVFFDNLLLEIEEAAESLEKRPTLGSLHRYKGLVRRFLDEILSKVYQVRMRPGRAREGHQKLHVVLEAIDERMAALAESIMNEQSESLSLVDKLDEIRGLLLDLYM
ncbi:MAG: YaaR family protein [bacterium]|jgi:hypothetical protein|nr:YaaR family protein [bacterium]